MTDKAYENWKRENGLDRPGLPNFPVLPSESKVAQIANASAKRDDRDAEDDN